MPTDSLLAVFIFSFTTAIGAVISPGPISTAVVSQSPRNGWRVGPLVSAGHALPELALTFLIAIGLSSFLSAPLIQTIIALVGGLLLLWMGGGLLVGVLRGKMHLPGLDPSAPILSMRQLLGLGVGGTLTNPFWYAWWVTVAAAYLAQAKALGAGAVAAFYLGHISVDFGWNTFLSTILGSGKRWISNRVYQGIIVLCALFLIYLGGVFLLQGWRSIAG
jgi:threonine/homoserine/homoserine lactone efflux protein